MLAPGGRIVVALSGGPDSVALAHVLLELQAGGHLVVAALAHFNHQLRGGAADEDEAFCVGFAADAGVPLEVGRADVRAIAREERRSIEDAGRRLRYEFLQRTARRFDAEAIAVGHSLDDQAETFLLRILRGAGTRGLGGIRPKAGMIVRPLIETRRAELRQYARDRRLSFREDETNRDLSVPRNRVRHELLPYLEREFSAGIVEVLAREAALARDDEDRLEQEAIEIARSLVLTDAPGDTVTVDVEALRSLHAALASRVARRALEPLADGRFVGFDHVARLLEFARSAAAGQAISLPGQRARLRASGAARLVLEREPARGVEQVERTFRVPLVVPGEVRTPGWTVSSERFDPAVSQGPVGAFTALVDARPGSLAVRFRRPGDRFEPPGMGGRSRKLQDYLVDRKVAREERDRLPLVVDENDRIVWVVGHGVSEGYRAPAASSGVILLKARRLGGEV